MLFLIVVGFISLAAIDSFGNGADQQNDTQWLHNAQKAISDIEYEVTISSDPAAGESEKTYHAANRAQNLRLLFDTRGITLCPRVSSFSSWSLTLTNPKIGRKGVFATEAGPILSYNGNCMEYVTRTYERKIQNERAGIIHEIGITEAPPGNAPLTVKMAYVSDLLTNSTREPMGVSFLFESEPVLDYGNVNACDTTGKALPARLTIEDNELYVQIADSDAVYPVVVTSMIKGPSTTADWIAQTDQDGAELGIAVAGAGDVNLDGYDDVIVGASLYDGGEEKEGAVFVYYGSASGLSATPNWFTESNQANAHFGEAVASAGDVNLDGYDDVIIGARYFTNGQTWEGKVFVFHGSASGLSASPNWSVESDQAWAEYGFAVGSAGDVNSDGYDDVIVGAHYYTNGQTAEGRAYVYHGSSSGLSTSPNWTWECDQERGRFGYAVGTAGDVNLDGYDDIIVGAPKYDNGEEDKGRVYVFHGSASGLSSSPNWIKESNNEGAMFGSSVGCAGDVNLDGYDDVIIGAPFYTNGQMNEGKIYVYHGSASGLCANPAWVGEGGQEAGWFGYSVGTAGDVNLDGYDDIIVGARNQSNGDAGEGRAYIWFGSASGLLGTGSPESAAWAAESNQKYAYFGSSVGSAGDVNSDGYDDVIVGAPYYDNTPTGEGRAYVFYGSPNPPPVLCQYDFTSDSEGWTFFGPVSSYQVPITTDQNGHIGLCPNGSSNVFSYWYSPDVQIKDGKTYFATWLMDSSAAAADSTVQFRLRVNQKGTWSAWDHIINSFLSHAPYTGNPETYSIYFDPHVSGAGDEYVQCSFDILSFNPDDDVSSWVYLEAILVDEIFVTPQEDIVHFTFDTDGEKWGFYGAVPPYGIPAVKHEYGRLCISPAGSSYCFSYLYSPYVQLESNQAYRVSWGVASNVNDADNAVQFRLRVNQVGAWASWDRIVNSFMKSAPSLMDKQYHIILEPKVTGTSDNLLALSFDLMSFDAADDVNSWLYLDEVKVEKVKISTFD